MSEEAIAEKKEEIEAEAKVPQYIQGEIHIEADGATGGISVDAPQNLIIALGLLETAKVILVQRQQQAMRAAEQPRILRGDVSILKGGPMGHS